MNKDGKVSVKIGKQGTLNTNHKLHQVAEHADYPTNIYTAQSGGSQCVSCETSQIQQISRMSEYRAGMELKDFSKVFGYFYSLAICLELTLCRCLR